MGWGQREQTSLLALGTAFWGGARRTAAHTPWTRTGALAPRVRASPLSTMPRPTTFRIHGERLAITRLEPTAAIPEWAQGSFVTISRTATELSIVCAARCVPPGLQTEGDRVAFGIEGVVPMTTVGLLASLCRALADVRVPVFVISTFDTDYLLVTLDRCDEARAALVAAGCVVIGSPPPT